MCSYNSRTMLCGPCVCLWICVVLSNTVLLKSTVQGAVKVKRSYEDSTAPAQSSEELMLMMQIELTSLRTKVESLENSATSQNKVSRLENSVTSLKNKVIRLENAMSRAVAFTARFSLDRDRYGKGVSLGRQQTVIFNEAITNIGDAYSTHSGIFTAPVAGIFAFFLTQMGVEDSPTIYLNIVKNGHTLDTVYAEGGSDPFDQGSTLVTTHLREGDKVWVRQNTGNAVRGYSWTVFTGYLLHAD